MRTVTKLRRIVADTASRVDGSPALRVAAVLGSHFAHVSDFAGVRHKPCMLPGISSMGLT